MTTVPDKTALAKIIKDLGMTGREFGEAIGYSDAERTARALVKGERHGKAYSLSGVAFQALTYMTALHRLVAAHAAYRVDHTPHNEEALVAALEAASAALPERLRPKDMPA